MSHSPLVPSTSITCICSIVEGRVRVHQVLCSGPGNFCVCLKLSNFPSCSVRNLKPETTHCTSLWFTQPSSRELVLTCVCQGLVKGVRNPNVKANYKEFWHIHSIVYRHKFYESCLMYSSRIFFQNILYNRDSLKYIQPQCHYHFPKSKFEESNLNKAEV